MLTNRIKVAVLVTVAAFGFSGQTLAVDPDWTVETVDTTGSTGWSSSLAFDPTDGAPSVSFLELSKNQIKFAHANGLVWVTETVATGRNADLGYDAVGRPCLSMLYGSKSEVRFARREGGRWTFQLVDKGGGGNNTSLAFDPAGNPVIAYIAATRNVSSVRLARWNGAAWTTEIVETVRANYLSLALDALGRPAVAYSADADLDGTIDSAKLASWDGSAWVHEVVDAGRGVGMSISVAFDPLTGAPAMAYVSSNTPRGPRFARKGLAGWEIETIQPIEYAFTTSLKFDGTGRAYVFYVDGKDPADDVMLAWRDAGGWTLETIDAVVGVNGWNRSLALGPGGIPAASFRASSVNQLRYASRTSVP